MINLKTLQWRLAETIQWCNLRANRADPEKSLRSPELNPHIDPYNHQLYSIFGSSGYQKAVDELAIKRATILQKENSYPTSSVINLNKGRLLLFFPWANTLDGGADDASENFYDGADVPAWDTWVSFLSAKESNFGDLILCWIPKEFEELAAGGVYVSAVAHVQWADDLWDTTLQNLKEYNLWPAIEALLTQLPD